MVWRLVIDAIWRARWTYLSGTAFLAPVWLLYASVGPAFRDLQVPALSMVVAVGLGPVFSMATMTARELWHLPLTGRDLRVATWLVSTLVPTTFLLGTKVMAVLLVTMAGGTATISMETLALSAVFDFVWTGAVLYVWAKIDGSLYAAPHWGWTGRVVGMLAFGTVVIGGIGAPIMVGHLVPLTFDAVTWPVLAVLAGCLVLNVATLFWTPSTGLFAGDRPRVWRRPALPGAAAAPPRALDRLTGLPRIVVPYLLLMQALSVTLGCGYALFGLATGREALWFVPSDGGLVHPEHREVTFLLVLPSLVCALVAPWNIWARHLKMLPLSVRQITGILVLTPFAGTLFAIAIIWGAYSLVHGALLNPRVDLLVGMAGVGALVHAGALRFQGSPHTFWVGVLCYPFVNRIIETGLADSTHVAFGVAGGLATLLAAGINHSTLTHSTSSSAAYQRPKAPFGPAPSGVR